MFDLTLAGLLTRLVVLLPIIAVHGFFLCLAARLLGDDGPSQDGRLTLNPLVHLDMLGALAFLAFGVGWITPLKLTPSALKGGICGVLRCHPGRFRRAGRAGRDRGLGAAAGRRGWNRCRAGRCWRWC